MADQLQSRLLKLAATFLCLFAIILTLSPAVRERSWLVSYRWSHWIGLAVWGGLFALAHRQTVRHLPERDPYLLPIAGLLSGWGLMTIWRLDPAFGLRQTIWLVLGVGVLILGLHLPGKLGILRRYKYLWLSGGLLLTALTLIFGTNPAGSGPRLWLGCCGVYLQPSEPLKLLLVIYLAAYLADRLPERLRIFPLIFPTLLLTSLALLILLVQSDLGTASIFIVLYAAVLYLTTGRRRVLLASAITLALSGIIGYWFIPIVHIRVIDWLNPWLDPSGRSYQIVQSLLAVANGGLIGRGPGLGSPTLVPISHSDFIYAAIAEETGLLGTIGLLALFALLISRGLRAALFAQDRFRRLLAAGLTAYLGIQSLLIIGGNLRLVPLTGVTLPFVSYGGSSLATSFFALLLLLLIGGQPEREPAAIPNPRPYFLLGALLGVGIASAALANGWWSVIRSADLLTRTDNPRRTIADLFVPRGDLLDRNNTPIDTTQGQIGQYSRHYLYPDLAPVTGYTHTTYGQAGLEASLDNYLRGLQGNPASLLWWNQLLYGQPPPGLNVRLSLDLNLQQIADSLMGDQHGAVVLLNAQNGELLVLSSHPTFNPTRLDATGELLAQDTASPLLDRTAQGQYSPGTALAPFLLAASTDGGELPPLPSDLSMAVDGQTFICAYQLAADQQTWTQELAAGCPAPLNLLGQRLGAQSMLNLFDSLGFYQPPDLRLPTAPASTRHVTVSGGQAAIGLGDLHVSPLQMALAAAALSNGGVRPAPQLALAVDTPKQGWVVLPPLGNPSNVFSQDTAEQAAQMLMAANQPYWQVLATAYQEGYKTAWYLAGTLPGWQGTPLALAVVLEEGQATQARAIGQKILHTALKP